MRGGTCPLLSLKMQGYLRTGGTTRRAVNSPEKVRNIYNYQSPAFVENMRKSKPSPCDLQDPLRVKMSAITGSITKKRKKSDAKPQSQINKCLNEKRRRTQENLFIDELTELIFPTDMSSGKTDKCQILQRTVDQIRHIRQQEGSNSHAVQQGEVSSSNRNILSNDQVGSVVLEALDGFLFIVNTEGRVEYVTENIRQYINYTKDDVLGKDIYNIIHHGDHNTFMPSLLPTMSLGWTSEPQPQRNRTFNCRFLVKPPDDTEETMEEKQQRVSKYESMQICSALLPSNSDRLESGDVSSESSDIGPSVMCVARRIPPNEKPIGSLIEQFTVKLDTTGKIITVDISGLSDPYSKYLNKDLIGTTIKDLCHPHDLSKLTAHLNDTLQVGRSTSVVYRLRVSPDKFLNIQTNSKLFKASMMNSTDFIMATNSIIGDNDLTPIEGGQLSNNKVCSGHSSNRCANNSNNNNGNNKNNVGGPLMPATHLNGQVSGISGRGLAAGTSSHSAAATSSNSIVFSAAESCNNPLPSLSTSNSFNHFLEKMDLEFELFRSSPWDLDSSSGWADRPESRASGPPNSRPSSQPAPTSPSPQGTFSSNSAVAPHCSPLRAFSPTSGNAAHTFSNSFPFSPLQESQTSSLTNSAASSVSANGAAAGLTPKRQDEGKTGCSTTNQSAMEAANVARNNATPVAAATATTCGGGGGGGGGQSSAASATVVETQNSVVSTDSGRLRNLLTKGASASEDSQDNTNNDSNSQNNHTILKILLNQQDEDDFHPEHNNKVRTSPSTVPKPSMEHSKSTLGNNMLLQLLNEKNDDEDEEVRGFKKRNELLQQLLKDQDDERKVQEQQCKPQTREEDPLLRSLGFRNTTPSPSQSGDNVGLGGSSQVGQKRPGDDGDLNIAVKRPMDGTHQVSSSGTPTNATSKLWEKNKMLASLLAKQPPQPTTIPPIPASVISETPQDKLLRIKQQTPQPTQPQSQQQQQAQQQQQQQQQPWTGGSMQSVGGNNTITTTATSARTPLQSQSRQLPRTTANTYLNHVLSQQQRPQLGQMDSEFTGSGEHHQTSTDPSGWDNQSSDPDLSDILDQVIEFVPDEAITDSSAIANLLDVIEAPQNNVLNEKMAISAIQKSLMLCETAVNPTSSTITIPGTPPAYSTALVTTPVTTSHSYQPPPMYQQQTRMRSTTQLVRQNTAQFTQQQQLQLHQQRAKLMQQHQQQQQQQRQRLLQQQQQQQLLIPSNATATDQITTGIQNIDNLLNNTVAPNVSLQRSSVPDSQVSPGYGGSVQMPSSGHRLAHSYSHPSTLPQHPIVNNNFNSGQQVSAAARLSPHSPAGILSFSHPQPLSPRVTQGNYGNTPRLFNVNQVRTQQQPTAQQQLQQQQRSMSSPGTPAPTRQSPFPAETFPPPTSPTASQFPPGPNPGAPNPSTQYRLQRTTSTPSATTQLPGGLGSPRHYGGVSKEQPLLSPSHPHSGCPSTPTHNQHNVTNTQQHFSNQQHSSMIYHTTANTINTADMQNNQFCYDRTSVPLYSSGPGDTQDGRSLPPGNPVNHQLGGNASSTSEFVRQELRAIVGARTQQQQQQRVPNNLQNNLPGQVSQDDLDALVNFEMSSADFYGGSGSR